MCPYSPEKASRCKNKSMYWLHAKENPLLLADDMNVADNIYHGPRITGNGNHASQQGNPKKIFNRPIVYTTFHPHKNPSSGCMRSADIQSNPHGSRPSKQVPTQEDQWIMNTMWQNTTQKIPRRRRDKWIYKGKMSSPPNLNALPSKCPTQQHYEEAKYTTY